MSTVQEIEQAALKLPRKERAELAKRLFGSLATKRDKEIAEAWATGSEARIDAYEAGIIKSVPVETVLKYRGRSGK